MTVPNTLPPSGEKISSSAAERFFAVAELRHRLCTVADNTTVTLLARTNLQLLPDAVRVLYRSIDFNTWLRLYPATGLAQPSALDGPRKGLYGEAVKALRITNMIPDGAGFAHGVELHMRDQGLTSDVQVALLGPRTRHGHVPQRDFAMSVPILVQHLRPHFPKLREIRIVSTGYTSEYFDDLDAWTTRPDECSVHLDVDPNNGNPAVPTGIIRRTKYGHNSLFGFAIWPKESAGFTTEFRVHAICPVSDAKKRWISINAHQGNMQVDVDPSVTAVLDLCFKHASGPRDFAAIDLICDSPQWTFADVRYLLEGLASRVGGGKVERFRTFTRQPYQHDALRGMLTSTCIADLGITELDLVSVDQPAELDPDWYMTVGSLVELLDALPACLESLSVSCIALEQLPRWPVVFRTPSSKLRTLRIRFSGDLRTSDVINSAYLMSRYTTPGCQIWTWRCIERESRAIEEGAWDESDDEDDYDLDEDDYSDSEDEHAGGVGSGDGSEDESQDRSEDGSEDGNGGSGSGTGEGEPLKSGKRLSNLEWTYSMAMLKRPAALDGLDLRKLGMVSPSTVVQFCELPDKEKRAKIEELRGCEL